jgi:hypothetical protein
MGVDTSWAKKINESTEPGKHEKLLHHESEILFAEQKSYREITLLFLSIPAKTVRSISWRRAKGRKDLNLTLPYATG